MILEFTGLGKIVQNCFRDLIQHDNGQSDKAPAHAADAESRYAIRLLVDRQSHHAMFNGLI